METPPTQTKEVLLAHSPAVDSVWRMAAREAAASLYRYIEREHLLLALLTLEKGSAVSADSKAESLHGEFEELHRIFAALGLEPAAVAESLRKRIGTQDYKHLLKVVHRSEACRSIFHCANRLANAHGETTVRCIYVLAAILADPGEHLPAVLKDCGADLNALRRQVEKSSEMHCETPAVKLEAPQVGEPHQNKTIASPEVAASTSSSETYHLVRLRGKQQAEMWPLRLDRALLIGRSVEGEAGIDIDLRPDDGISQSHARLWFSRGCWRIEDLNSVHGILVGGRQIKGKGPAVLDLWKEVQIGDTILMLVPPRWHRVRSHDLIVDLETVPMVNLGVLQCSSAIVSRLMATNPGGTQSVSRRLQISLSEFAVSEPVTLPPLTPGQTAELDVPNFRFDYDALECRVEKSACLLSVRVGQSALEGPPVEIWLLPANEWTCGRTYENQLSLASFVMPNHPSVDRLVAAACSHFPAEHDPAESLRSLYEYLLKNWELNYIFEPPAWGEGGQKIRFPHQVLSDFAERQGHGTCIDLALLLAAALEHLHHESLIAVLDLGDTWHSLAGCRRSPREGMEPLLYEKERILADAIWVDPNGCTRAPEYGWEFARASNQADSVLAGHPLVFALDVAAARRIGKVEPLPFSGQPELGKELRAAFAKANEIGHCLHQPVGTVHILLGLLTIDNGITREIFGGIGMPADRVIERLRAGLSNVSDRGEDGHASTRHHDMVLSIARSLAKRAGLNVVTERFVLEALLLTPSSAMDNALRNLGTARKGLYTLLGKSAGESKTYPTLPSSFPNQL